MTCLSMYMSQGTVVGVGARRDFDSVFRVEHRSKGINFIKLEQM